MAAGGTFTVQNKVRPGVYFRFRSKNKQDLTVGDRGIAALCEPLHWGPTAKVIEIDAGADMTVYTGYDITALENRFLTEIFKGTNRTAAPRKVLLYRPTASVGDQVMGYYGCMLTGEIPLSILNDDEAMLNYDFNFSYTKVNRLKAFSDPVNLGN